MSATIYPLYIHQQFERRWDDRLERERLLSNLEHRTSVSTDCLIRLDEDNRQVIHHKREASLGRAADLAETQLDRFGDTSTSADDRAKRKSQLLDGPREFREVRIDNETLKQ